VRFVDRPASLQQIVITMELASDLPQIWGDADLIKQVILNVLVNAQQAIEGPGTIVVVSRHYVARTAPKPGTQSVPMVEVAIEDSGCGIPQANMQRIFDPFFTSKEVGKGTGLGLSVSYGIVKAHGGEIKVASIAGQGTTFRILLPIRSPFSESQPTADESTQ
jgi:signal transduction histidine kinase